MDKKKREKIEKRPQAGTKARQGAPYLHVALVGECSCGKSTFLNNIIGERLLATDLLVTTAIPTYISWDGGNQVNVEIFRKDGKNYRLDPKGIQEFEQDFQIAMPPKVEQLLDDITTNNELSGKLEKVQVNFPRQKRYDSICMIDTPGINPGQEGTQQHVLETQRIIMEAADMAVILFPATQVMKKSFTDFLGKYTSHLMQDAVFVITQMDLIPDRKEREKVLCFVEDRLKKTFELDEVFVYGSSAELALRYHSAPGAGNEEEKIWSDRFDSMWDEILERFQARKVKLLFEDGKRNREQILEALSQLTSGDSIDYGLCWDMEMEKLARVMTNAKAVALAMKLPGMSAVLRNDLEALVSQCRCAQFQIAIVGVMKAGKSMLMNALMGAEIASVDITPETASLTKFRSISSGYYVKVRFHSRTQWNRLCASARENPGGELCRLLESPEVERLADKWIGHKEITIMCSSLEELKARTAHWTSARSNDHLFAAEVEVGISREIFNMPDEVIFVDTPGLHDPVQYRSDITKEYIRKANAVLIAVPTGALTTEGLGTITTVLDYVGSKKEKAYIVATKKDMISSQNCEKVIKSWMKDLVSARRYQDMKEAASHILVTSAYMYMQLQKFTGLEEEELDQEEKFSDEEYIELESYAKKVLKKKRRYNIETIRDSAEDRELLEQEAGIPRLRRRLERSLIARYRELKRRDMIDEYLRCRKELLAIAKETAESRKSILESARKGAKELRKRLDQSSKDYEEAKEKNQQIRKAMEDVRRISDGIMDSL